MLLTENTRVFETQPASATINSPIIHPYLKKNETFLLMENSVSKEEVDSRGFNGFRFCFLVNLF